MDEAKLLHRSDEVVAGDLKMNQPSQNVETLGYAVSEVRDWVNRPIAVRRQRMSETNTPPRPLNAFMLYRKAYAIHLKNRTTKPDQKLVSKSAGRRWQQESLEVKDFYRDLARLERERHAVAFPNYRFAPRKEDSYGRGWKVATTLASYSDAVPSAGQTCAVGDARCQYSPTNDGDDEDQALYLEVLQWLADEVTHETPEELTDL